MARFSKRPSIARRNRRIETIKRTLVFLVSITLIVSGGVFLFRQEAFLIKEVQVNGVVVISPDEIKKIASEELSQFYLGLIPKSVSFLYPKQAIKEKISGELPELYSVGVSLKGFKVLEISAEERRPYAVWCSGEEKATCYFSDTTGFIYKESPDFSGALYLRLTGPLLGESLIIKNRFLEEDDFIAVARFIEGLKTLNLKVVSFEKMEGGDAVLKLEKSGEVRITLNESLDGALSNLESATETDPLKKNLETKRGALEYIDLRFGNKVFYKFK